MSLTHSLCTLFFSIATDAPVFTAATAAGDSAAAPSGNSAAPSPQGDVLLTTAGPKTIVENIDADSSLAVLERVVSAVHF